jgi:hypothetical protein
LIQACLIVDWQDEHQSHALLCRKAPGGPRLPIESHFTHVMG